MPAYPSLRSGSPSHEFLRTSEDRLMHPAVHIDADPPAPEIRYMDIDLNAFECLQQSLYPHFDYSPRASFGI